jgi:hypothetical protein|tara:strand:+ start:1820 stop:2311 length:492 start_codon:yes stop_codon:yes gene_type:complete
MILISTEGRWPKTEKVEKYAYNCLMHFYRKEPVRDIHMDLKLTSRLEGAVGYCIGDKESVQIEVSRQKRFKNKETGEVTWKKVTLSYLMRTLAHEVVHAKQFLKNEMSDDGFWFKHKGVKKSYIHEPYHKQPWEHQAFMYEEFLYKLYWENHLKIDMHRKFMK